MASSNNSDPVSGGWLQWVYDSMCVLEHIWTTADIQLELSIYLLAGVVVLWILIGMAWWNYEEAISNLFELRSNSVANVQVSNLASSSSEFIAPWQDHSFQLSPETKKLTQRIRHPQT
ncbi:uncharacterized protein [Dysidea avara]|uniref:uncharacterized protein isoform X1 n=1 Tax=Dysidea avara TaxID=196820 RepID=UPI0033338F42